MPTNPEHRQIRIPLLVAAGFAAACLPLQAREVSGLARVDSVFITVTGGDTQALKRDNMDRICSTALAIALKDYDFDVASTRLDADAELVLTGSSLTITQGRAKDVGKVVLNYAVTLETGSKGNTLFSTVGAARGESVSEACQEAAEEIADQLDDAKDDAD